MSRKGKQILYHSPSIWGNTDFYRTTGVLPFINHPKLMFRDVSHFGTLSQWDISSADVMIIQRPSTGKYVNLIKLAKSCGVKIVIDYDDDVLNVDFYNPTFVQYKQQRDMILECVELADEAWCSTESVRDSLGRGIVVPNALNTELLGSCSQFNSESNKVVWRGGSTHEADMYENADFIVDMVNSHPELDFYFIGHRFTYFEQRCGDNYNSVDGMPIMQYFNMLKELKPRAMIFPLCDTMLNRGKSNISWIEASLCGAAYFGNTMLPEFNLNGTLPLSGFDTLIHNENCLNTAHSLSAEKIQDNLLLSKINEIRVDNLLSL